MTVTPPPARPRVSVIIPAYNSHDTIAPCLDALSRQTYRAFEVVVVDSGPDLTTSTLVPERFPWVTFVRSPRRLFPHAARNAGVARSTGELLLFTDPDIYGDAHWIERLVDAHDRTGHVIVGALACFGERWLDRGLHLCKFSAWLPGGSMRPTHLGPTANLLISRAQFGRAGGLPDEGMLGDVTLSWNLQQKGQRLTFVPTAIVEHHHIQSFGDFIAERYTRGRMYGQLRLERWGRRLLPPAAMLVMTVLPVRMARIVALSASQASGAHQLGWWAATLPVIAAGHAAALVGEASAYARRLSSRHRASMPEPRAVAQSK